MIACYLRVSTYDQDNAAQRAALTQWLVAQGHDPEQAVWFEDTATGANLDRPAFEKLQADIFAGKITTVVVFKLDRLSRDIAAGVNLLCDWIDRRIRVVAISQQLDFSGSMGKLMAAVIIGLADIEREFIHERQAIGIARAKERGVYRGRKPGSIKGRAKGQKIDLVQQAAKLRAQNRTIAQIMAELGIGRGTVYRYLQRAMEEDSSSS